MQQGHIAWQYDVDHLYGPVQPVNYNTEQEAAFRGGNTSEVVLNQNQHFIVWMRPAAQPTFRKLWAVIDVPLLAGAYPLIAPVLLAPELWPSVSAANLARVCCTGYDVEMFLYPAWNTWSLLGGSLRFSCLLCPLRAGVH